MQKDLNGFLKTHAIVLIFLLIYALLIGYKLNTYQTPFYNWDESIYAEVGKEMVQKHSLVPLWQGKAWLDKPPLAPLYYGVAEAIIPFSPEVATRFSNLAIAILVLLFAYLVYFKISKNTIISTLTVIITAFIPAFLQRAQVLNVDVFLLLGWLGYVLFFEHYVLSLFFLSIAVLSKSLLGFYPPAIFFLFYSYKLATRQIKITEYKKKIFHIISQVVILSIWYIVMYIFYGNQFIQAHFIESHFKRVTASIESHFGKKTFYIDLLVQEFGWLIYLSFIGIILILKDFVKKKDYKKILLGLFFVPWFAFLNLTKTKIAWYLYPVIPQFAYLASLAVLLLYKNKLLYYGAAIGIVGILLYQNFANNAFFKTNYSSEDEYYHTALFARDRCNKLSLLIDNDSRKTHDTLKSMNLLISTSEWWGSQPRVVYYFGRPVNFLYDKEKFIKQSKADATNNCIIIEKADSDIDPTSIGYKFEKDFNGVILFSKSH